MSNDEDAGKKLVAVDIGNGCSPAVQAVLPVSASARRIVEALQAELRAVVEKHLPGCEWLLRPIEVRLCRRSGYILPRGEQKARDEKNLAGIREFFGLAAEVRRDKRANNPHNGTLGWWRVCGIRHSAVVRATTADEALEKSEIDSWESPDVEWIGEELPDVIGEYEE